MRRPTLSPTKLTCYLACPHRYYWTYINPKGQWFLRAHSYFSFGASLHKALEAFHSSGEKGIAPVEALFASYEEKWIDAGYRTSEEMQVAFGEGKLILERYAENQRTMPSTAKVLHVEKSLRKQMGEWDLVGRVDRIDEMPDGSLLIVDYKSGRAQPTDQDVADDIAMNAYALMLRDQYPGRPIAATLIPLREGEPARHRFEDDQIAEFEFSVRELGDKIMNHYWEEFLPFRKGLCTHCDFVTLCRKVPGYLEAAGIFEE